jgi:hypothetical protein
MRSRLIASILIVFAAAMAPAGQSKNTAVLSGRVVTDTDAPRPVRRATVRLAGAGTTTRLVGTDDEGKFRFEALPAGTFTLSATKPGYVPTFHGSKHPGRGPGVRIAVADGGRVDVTVRIVPGAAITGLVADALGRPAPAIPVAAVAVRAGDAAPARTTTDDRGIYRIYGLAPGEYLVSALPRLMVASARGTVPAEPIAVTDEEVQWARRAIEGRAPGQGPPMPAPGRAVAYAPVYYPGTTDAAAAARVSVGVGEERGGIDMALRVVPMSRIAGSLMDAGGQPLAVSAAVSLHPRRREQASAADTLVSSGALALPRAAVSGSTFSIAGVAPGEYTLFARTGGSRGRVGAPPPGESLWSVTDLLVDGFDQTDLALHLLPGLKLTGSIAFERSTLAPPADLSGMELSLAASGTPLGTASAPRAVVEPAGAFRFSSIPPGFYTLKAAPPAASGGRWTLKSAMVKGGRDLSDGRFEVKSGAEDVEGVVITFTDRPSEISGRLLDAAGAATRYSIVVFPADTSQWLPDSRRIRATPPSTDGSFSIVGLPPGEYAMAATEDADPADLADAAFLSQLLASSFRLTLAEGERKRQDLRLR